MWKPDICIYHANCLDGFGAAWAVWKRWGDAVQYVPAQYGHTLNVDVTDKQVLFVDFSLSATELMAMPATSIVVLDHHQTAEEELKRFCLKEEGELTFETIPRVLSEIATWKDGAIIAIFNERACGARLAWDFFHPHQQLPNLLLHIEDRDLWRFSFYGTTEIIAALSSYEMTFDFFSGVVEEPAGLLEAGKHILRARDKAVADLCKTAAIEHISGCPVPCVNAPSFMASDVGHALLKQHPEAAFAATFHIAGGTRCYSLRSENQRSDVSAIAKRYGGGGHRNAAGFNVPEAACANGAVDETANREITLTMQLHGTGCDAATQEAVRKVTEALRLVGCRVSIQFN
jgi:oligoribonuclease NrnB/cAMP/cGMP phosphodiesterase (DHH superfamily)